MLARGSNAKRCSVCNNRISDRFHIIGQNKYCDLASINPNSLATDPASTNCYAAAVKTVLGSNCLDLVVAAADPAVPIHCYPALRSTTHQGYDPVPDAVPEVLVHIP